MNLNTVNRIYLFKAGVSIAEIARRDEVKFISVYHYLVKQGVITDSYLSDEFEKAMTRAGLPTPEKEYPFVRMAPPEIQALFLSPKLRKVRGWRADYAFPAHQLAIEIDGGRFVPGGGAHAHDREKRLAYAVLRYRVLYFDTKMLENPDACVEWVRIALMGVE